LTFQEMSFIGFKKREKIYDHGLHGSHGWVR
jgi:hypothetical protein